MFVHLHIVVCLHILHCSGIKIHHPDGVKLCVPINVLRSIFNGILPIRDRWVFDLFELNDGHWLIRTKTWAIRAKD